MSLRIEMKVLKIAFNPIQLSSITSLNSFPCLHPLLIATVNFNPVLFSRYTGRALTLGFSHGLHVSSPRSAVSVTRSQLRSKADDPPSDLLSEGQQPNTTTQCLCHSPHFISSHRHFIPSQHHKKKDKCSTVRYFERLPSRNFHYSILL